MAFQFHGRAQDAAENILRLFQTGDVPVALAPVFIRRHDAVPCRAWSWSNQLLTALAAHDDARGFRQCREEGRYVREGERGFPILVPCHAKRTVRDDDKGEEREILALVGFRSCVGLEKEADPGGCWQYVRAYATAAKIEPVTACQRVLKRTCDAIALILAEYDRIQGLAAGAATVESEVAA